MMFQAVRNLSHFQGSLFLYKISPTYQRKCDINPTDRIFTGEK